MSDAPTLYDDMPYPTAIFTQTQPDRLATLARCAGLNPPPIETARVLEIAASDGMNLHALAVAYPKAEFLGFDLAPTAVERGRRWLEGSGVTNVRLEVMDILDAADQIEGEFDYIIAHGLYAWVPPHVREATMALIDAKLSPDGVAFVSYNAMPGGYIRLALRDMLNFALEGVASEDRETAATLYLKSLAEPEPPENPAQTAFRDAVKFTLNKDWGVLCHDELGPCFFPQYVSEVARAASANGLKFLGDADRERIKDIFLPDEVPADGDPDAQIVRIAEAADYRQFRFFRQSLLVRAEKMPSRRLVHSAMDELYACSRCHMVGENSFQLGQNVFEVSDEQLAAALTKLTQAVPGRIRVSELVDDDTRRVALFQLFNVGLIDLCAVPEPFVTSVSERPRTSSLTRHMLSLGMNKICTLDHRLMAVPDFGPRHLLMHLDGTRDRAALAEIGRAAGLDTPQELDRALEQLAYECLLLA